MKWVFITAFLIAVVLTIVGMGPLAFLLALGSMFVFGGFQVGVDALFRSLRNRRRAGPGAAGPAEERANGRALLTAGTSPFGRRGSRWSVALRLGQRFADRLRPKLRENRF